MEILNITKEKENFLFKRREIGFDVKSAIAPSNEETRKIISEKFLAKPETIRIKKITGNYGSNVFSISANVYESEKQMLETESFSKKQKEKDKKQAAEKQKEPTK